MIQDSFGNIFIYKCKLLQNLVVKYINIYKFEIYLMLFIIMGVDNAKLINKFEIDLNVLQKDYNIVIIIIFFKLRLNKNNDKCNSVF